MTQLKDAFGSNINPNTTSNEVAVENDTLTNVLSTINGDISGLSSTVSTLESDVAYLKNTPINTLASSGTVSLTSNTLYQASLTGNITFSLPTVSDVSKHNQIKIYLYMQTVYTITLGTTHYINGDAPDLSEAGNYMIYYDYLPTISSWSVGAMKIS